MTALFALAPNWEYQMSITVDKMNKLGYNRLLHTDENKKLITIATPWIVTCIL